MIKNIDHYWLGFKRSHAYIASLIAILSFVGLSIADIQDIRLKLIALGGFIATVMMLIHWNRGQKLSQTYITLNAPLVRSKNASARFQSMIDMIYLYTRLDQIESTGAWGKSLVSLFYPLLIVNNKRDDKPSDETKKEGGLTTTSLTLLSLRDFWLRDEKYSTQPFVLLGKEYFHKRSSKGFGTLCDTKRDGQRSPTPSARHTAMACLALIGLNGRPDKLMDGLDYLTRNLEVEIEGKEKCPSVALAASIAAFEYFIQSDPIQTESKQYMSNNVRRFLHAWPKHRLEWENRLLEIKSDNDVLWPPYAELKEFSFYSSLMVYGLIPGILQGEHERRFFNFCDILFSSECGGGVPFYSAMKNPDFGTTAKVLSLLLSPAIANLFKERGKERLLNEKISQYESFLEKNYEAIESDIFKMIYTETASSLLAYGTLEDNDKQMARIKRLENVVTTVEQAIRLDSEKPVINHQIKIDYPYLDTLIGQRILNPYANC